MQDFKRLLVWQVAHACLLDVERALRSARAREIPGLRAQAVRAAASIAANIAEGCGKPTKREFLRYLGIASGSSRELENHLIAARDLGAITAPQFASLDDRVGVVRRMLAGLIRSLRLQPERPAR